MNGDVHQTRALDLREDIGDAGNWTLKELPIPNHTQGPLVSLRYQNVPVLPERYPPRMGKTSSNGYHSNATNVRGVENNRLVWRWNRRNALSVLSRQKASKK
tara:strand:+ start:334 stop:639 length:306 start_codon:yes stop_codon:yes gene_type:complete